MLGCVLASGCHRTDDHASESTAASDANSAATVWRFAIEESEGSVQHEYALEFERRIESKSNGRIDVVVYPYGALGTSMQTAEQLNMGILEFAMASPGIIGSFIPELQVFLLHYVFSTKDEINRQVLSDPRLLEFCDSLYAEKGFKLLTFFPEGEMVWTTQQEIRSPADFAGVKMRVMTSPILLSAYNAYGASATPMDYADVYSGLQLNMIDAQVNPIFAIERQKFHEVTDWLIFPKHAQFITSAAASKTFFESLSDNDRQMVVTTIDELQDYIFELQLAFQSERLKTIFRDKINRKRTLHILGDIRPFQESLTAEEHRELIDQNQYLEITDPLSIEETDAFRQKSVAVQDVFLRIGGERGPEILNMILDTVQRIEQADSANLQ
ncbi:MAG: TRAP transporter substrate-binding protein DctP [Pirellulaceae bacterium]